MVLKIFLRRYRPTGRPFIGIANTLIKSIEKSPTVGLIIIIKHILNSNLIKCYTRDRERDSERQWSNDE